MKKILRGTYHAGVVLLFILVAAAGFTQTRVFRSTLREFILDKASAALQGRLSFNAIEGNLLTGFTLRDVRLQADSLDLLAAERLEIRYDPLMFPFRRIAVTRATIVGPVIRIWRGTDSVWNVSRIVRPAPPDSQPSPWTIDLRNVSLVDARVQIVDSVRMQNRLRAGTPPLPPEVVDYARIDLDSLQLNLSAQIARGNIFAQIHNLACVSTAPVLAVRHLQADLSLTKDLVSARDVRIETRRSRLRLSAALHRVDVRRLRSAHELQSAPIELDLSAAEIDTRELRQWLYPSVDFLDGSYRLRLKARGTFGGLEVTDAAVEAGESSVQLSGRIDHLDRPSAITLDLFGRNNRVHPADLQAYLPGLLIPDFRYLGDGTFSAGFAGRLSDFRAFCRFGCDAGTFEVDGTIRTDSGEVVYKGTARTENADLSVLTGKPGLASRLNARIAFDGSGTDVRRAIALVRVEVDSSLFKNLPVRSSVIVLDAADGTFRAHAQLRADETNVDCSGQLALGANDTLSYALDARVNSLNLADVFGREALQSDLSFSLKAGGRIARGNVRADSAVVGFLPSVMADEPFPENTVNLRMTRDTRGNDELTLRSEFCDLNAAGRFTLGSLYRGVEGSVAMASGAVRRYALDLDSLRTTTGAGHHEEARRRAQDSLSLDVRVHADAKDMYMIGVLLFEEMEGDVTLDGRITGAGDSLHTAVTAHAQEFAWAFPKDTLVILKSSLAMDLTGTADAHATRSPAGTFGMNGQALALRSAFFAHPQAMLALGPDSIRFDASAFVDSIVRVQLAGTGWIEHGVLTAGLDRASIGMGDYTLENTGPFQLRHGKDGFLFSHAKFVHDAEEIMVDGLFDPSGWSDCRLSVRGFLLSGVQSILRGRADMGALGQYTGLVNAEGTFRGTFREPQFALNLDADGVRVHKSGNAGPARQSDVILGHLGGRMSYQDRRMDLFVNLRHDLKDTTAPPDLLLRGSAPFDLSVGPGDGRPLEGSLDLELRSQGIDMVFLEPFIPEVSGLTGRMTCAMRMVGPVDAPVYDGTIAIRGARLMFRPVGLRYELNADLVAAGDRIEFHNTTVRNMPEDGQPDGIMDVAGNFRMRGLKFRDFDLLTHGPLLVMNSETRRPGQKFYGRLVIVPGPAGLHWQGNFEQSLLKGEVFVRRASLTFPPERETETVRASRVAVAFVDDTSRTPAPAPAEVVKRPLIDPFTEGNPVGARGSAGEERSFIDRITYDVSLETQGPTQLRLVFNPQTNEELFADLQGRLYFYRTPEVAKLTGTVEVNDRSYYNFIKKFTVSQGQLLYTGDPLNPEIDLTAQFIGEHRIRDSLNNPLALGKVEKVAVTLKITGTRNEPKPKMSLEVDNKKRTTGEEESDALSFILAGQFRDELTDQQRTGLIGTNFGFGLASGMLTGPLSEMLRRQTGFIQSVDVMYYGGSSFDRSADVRLTGQVGEAVIRLGGRVLNDLNNTNASVELPMSSITGNMELRNLILTLERRVEGIENLDDRRRSSNGARLYYRFSF